MEESHGNIRKLLDAAKAKTGSKSDYALAKNLEIPSGWICDYYKGRRVPTEYACLKISEITGTPLDEVIALVKCETEKDAKRRKVWDAYIKRLGGLAASVFVCVVTATNFAVEKAIQLALLSP